MKVPPTGEEYLNLTQVCKGELNSKDNPEPEVRTLIDISVRAYSEDYFDEKKGDVRFYMYSPGINAAKWKDFYSDEIIAIGWDEVDDLNNYSSRTEIVNKLREINEDNESHKNDSKALDDFKNEMRIGDIVYVKKGLKTILGRGVIKSDYYYDENAEEYKHRRKILWTHEVNFDHHWHNIVQKKLTNITYYKDYCRDLEELFSNEVIKIDNEKLDHNETVFADDDFIKLVYMKPEKYKSIVDTLLNKKNIILQGPPGVGKTFSSKLLAYSIMGKKDDERIQMVQFHQNYGYEDFVMGYRPNEDGFILKNGPFYEFCNKIRKDENENKKYFFIIDEINRGNLSRIFGELLMLIENDKRNHPIKLMYNSEEFSVPSNLYIIGLMNTADRSLAMIDYALRRRFAFIDLEPAFDSDGFKDMISRKYIDTKINIVLNYIKSINRDILEDENLGEGFLIGHSYFCPNDNEQVDDAWLESKLRHEIIPLLKEYWFDERGRVANYSNDLLGIFR
jgi:5-methylcytosine-specific restriction protein B